MFSGARVLFLGLGAILIGCGQSSAGAADGKADAGPDVGSPPPSDDSSAPPSDDSSAPPSDDSSAPLLDANFPWGGAGCGLSAAAFCDTFDKPSSNKGRAGELDSTRWSGGRLWPQLPTTGGQPFPIMPATVPACRAGLPATALPDDDTLICDSSADINSPHLLVLDAAQNYGENSYRIRQPFDFSNRTGKIVFDAEGFNVALLGWVSVEVTADPIPVPSFGILGNEEGAVIPQNAFEVQLNACGGNASGGTTGGVGVATVQVIHEFVDTVSGPDQATCVPAAQGKLNHFEIDVSQTKIDVYGTPASTDGSTFPPAQLLYSTSAAIPFARGYVHITTHNHATIKYSPNNDVRSWPARWDNVGFDGPVVPGWREYEIPDSLVPFAGLPFGFDNYGLPQGTMNVGYLVADAAQGPNATLHFKNVDVSNVVGARIALSSWYDLSQGTPSQFTLRYRLNGGPWHDRVLTAAEVAMSKGPQIIQASGNSNGGMQGAFAQMLDVPAGELVSGDNSLEFVAVNIPQGYPPAVSNIDLVLATSQ
jgi:hypothetical protein